MKPYYLLEPGDKIEEGDEYFSAHQMMWTPSIDAGGYCGNGRPYRRPIPDAPTPDDGWIPWSGGECPVAHDSWVDVKMRGGGESSNTAGFWSWPHIDPSYPNDIIAYHVVKAPEPQWLPLTCDDVPPGSVLRYNKTEKFQQDSPGEWTTVVNVDRLGVVDVSIDEHYKPELTFITFEDLMLHEILRPGEDWQPCRKLAK